MKIDKEEVILKVYDSVMKDLEVREKQKKIEEIVRNWITYSMTDYRSMIQIAQVLGIEADTKKHMSCEADQKTERNCATCSHAECYSGIDDFECSKRGLQRAEQYNCEDWEKAEEGL